MKTGPKARPVRTTGASSSSQLWIPGGERAAVGRGILQRVHAQIAKLTTECNCEQFSCTTEGSAGSRCARPRAGRGRAGRRRRRTSSRGVDGSSSSRRSSGSRAPRGRRRRRSRNSSSVFTRRSQSSRPNATAEQVLEEGWTVRQAADAVGISAPGVRYRREGEAGLPGGSSRFHAERGRIGSRRSPPCVSISPEPGFGWVTLQPPNRYERPVPRAGRGRAGRRRRAVAHFASYGIRPSRGVDGSTPVDRSHRHECSPAGPTSTGGAALRLRCPRARRRAATRVTTRPTLC